MRMRWCSKMKKSVVLERSRSKNKALPCWMCASFGMWALEGALCPATTSLYGIIAPVAPIPTATSSISAGMFTWMPHPHWAVTIAESQLAHRRGRYVHVWLIPYWCRGMGILVDFVIMYWMGLAITFCQFPAKLSYMVSFKTFTGVQRSKLTYIHLYFRWPEFPSTQLTRLWNF